MNFEFEFADKSQSKELLLSLFEILYTNMSRITPSDKTKEEELDEWYSNVYPAMQKPQRQIVLMLAVSLFVAAVSSFLPVWKIARRKPGVAIKNK